MWKERCQLVHWDSLLIQLNFMAFLKIHILPVEVMFCIETKTKTEVCEVFVSIYIVITILARCVQNLNVWPTVPV